MFTSGRFQFHSASTFQRNTLRRYIALELEIAQADTHSHIASACESYGDAIVHDGSLPEQGYEINLNPTNGDSFPAHVSAICEALNEDGADVSSECGMHVHVSADGLNWFSLYKLCLVYARVEDALYSLVARSRRGNGYCKPSGEEYVFPSYTQFKRHLLRVLYGHGNARVATAMRNGKRVFSERTQKYHSARYRALNLHSFFYRGTIEFRHHHGTTSAVKATNWGLICAWIVERADTMPYQQILALPTDSIEALCALLPSDLAAYARERAQQLAALHK